MAFAESNDEILELFDAVKPGACPICGRPILARRFESRALILQCSAHCGWWSEAVSDDGAAVRSARRPLLKSLRDGRNLPRLF